MAEEVERRRDVARKVIEATTASDSLRGEERSEFMRNELAKIEAAYTPWPDFSPSRGSRASMRGHRHRDRISGTVRHRAGAVARTRWCDP